MYSEDTRVNDLISSLKSSKNLTVQDFELGVTLGTGCFGRVLHVEHKTHKAEVAFALKILSKSEMIKLKEVEHVKSEKDILLSISHPFIAKMYAFFQDKSHVYMLLEYLAGGELLSRLSSEQRFDEDTARFYLSQVLLAIRHLHLAEIIYRDLKPENILIDQKGNVKLVDFGLARVISDNKTYTICGTPEYLAPEMICKGKKGYGKEIDWWAFGILVYEMLVG